MRFSILLAISVVLTSCVAPPSKTRDVSSVVRGYVSGTGGTLAGTPVEVAGTSLRTKADANGFFEIKGVPPGRHRVVIRSSARPVIIPVSVPEASVVEIGEGRVLAPGEMDTSTLQGLANASGVSAETLAAIAAECGVSIEEWEAFLATGKLPMTATGTLTKQDLLRMAMTAKEHLTKEEATALLAALTGMAPSELSEWLTAQRDSLASLFQADAIPVEALGEILKALMRDGKLDAGVLAAMKGGALIPEDAAEAATGEVVLYDAEKGTMPNAQNWWYLSDPFESRAMQEMTAGAVRLDSMPVRKEKTGYFTEDPVTGAMLRHALLPLLDREQGFTLGFSVQIVKESHKRDDRAGFSVIIVCEDLRAIELGFWKSRVWAQADNGKPIFQDSRAEGASFDTTAKRVAYELSVKGERYTLSADGVELLKGKLRDYTPFGGFPYDASSFVFLGDNTTSARADIHLARVVLRTHEAVSPTPEEAEGTEEAAPKTEFSLRDGAMLLAARTDMNPIDALRWLEEHAKELPSGAAGALTPASLHAALKMMQSDASSTPSEAPSAAAVMAGGAGEAGGGGGGGEQKDSGSGGEGGMASGDFGPQRTYETTEAHDRWGEESPATASGAPENAESSTSGNTE